MANLKRWINISYFFLAAITWVFFYYLTDTIWTLAGFRVSSDWYIQPSQTVAFAAAAAFLLVMFKNEKIGTFASEVATELSKVTWPERKETILSAGVISIMIAICAVILFAFDSLWGTVVKVIF